MIIDIDLAPTSARTARRSSRFWTPRNATMAKLREALDSDVVLLRGPAGVGKSALLRQFAGALEDDPGIGIQLLDAGSASAETLDRVAAGFRDGPPQHVLLVDNLVDKPGIDSAAILGLLRSDPELRVVVATRHVTQLESPLVALEFDVHVLAPADLLMARDELLPGSRTQWHRNHGCRGRRADAAHARVARSCAAGQLAAPPGEPSPAHA